MERMVTVVQSLLHSLRSAACTPFLPVAALGQEEIHSAFRREMHHASECLKLSDLLDGRADVFHPNAGGAETQRGEGRFAADFAHQPPEVSHNCPRRIRLVLLVQCVGTLLVPRCRRDGVPSLFARRDDGYGDMRAMFQQAVESHVHPDSPHREGQGVDSVPRQAEVLHQMMVLSGDALLVHLLLDASSYTQLTWADRQFILWLLRETTVTSVVCRSEHGVRILHWLQWLLRANVVGRRGQVDPSARAKQAIFPRKGTAAKAGNLGQAQPLRSLSASLGQRGLSGPTTIQTESSFASTSAVVVYAAVPSTCPTVNLLMRLLLVQELRLLLGSGAEWHSSESGRVYESNHAVQLRHIALQAEAPLWGHSSVHGAGHNTPAGGTTPAGTAQSRKTVQGALSPALTVSGTVLQKGAAYHTLASTSTLRGSLVECGFVESLLDVLFGELCSTSIYKLLREPMASSGHSRASQSYFADFTERESRVISDMEKEEWWGALATLGALLGGCDAAKDRLHAYVGAEYFVRFLMQHMDFLHAMPASKLSTTSIDYRSVLNTLLVEVCLRSGRFAPPRAPFTSVASRMPQHHSQQQANWSFSDSSAYPGAPHVESERFLPLYVRTPVNRTADVGASPTATVLRRGVPVSANGGTGAGGGTVSLMSPTVLSPSYFAHDRTIVLIRYVCRPCPLALTSDRFRRAFASPGSTPVPAQPSSVIAGVASNATVQPLKHHIPVSRGGVRSGEGLELRSRLSSEGDLNHFHLGMGSAANGALISRRLLLRRNVSTASVHSAESDNRWDQESVGMNSSAHGDGRGSFHSYHSLLALTQALTSSHANTPSASVCDETSSHFSAHPRFNGGTNGAKGTAEPEQPPDYLDEQTLLRSPFPPMAASGSGSVPRVYAPVLGQSGSDSDSASATLALMLLHHALLVRAGYSESFLPGELLDSPTRDDHSRQYSEDPLGNADNIGLRMSMISTDSAHGSVPFMLDALPTDGAYLGREPVNSALVLRKHLAMFIAPALGATQDATPQPAYSKLQISSPECCELLLCAAIIAAPEDQLFLISTLSQLLDGNPANAHGFILKPTTCVALARLVPTLHEETQEKVGYLLSQVLRYSLQQPVLRELLDVVKRSRSMSDDFGASLSDTANSTEEAQLAVGSGAATTGAAATDNKSLLFVMGRTAERTAPESFVHFDQSSAFHSAIELPQIVVPVVGVLTPSEITVCTWMRLGVLAEVPTASFLQLHSTTSDLLVNVYFRVLYKSAHSQDSKVSSGGIASSAANNGEAPKLTRRTVQLCLSFGKSVGAAVGSYENGVYVEEDEPPTPVPSVPVPSKPEKPLTPAAATFAASLASGAHHGTAFGSALPAGVLGSSGAEARAAAEALRAAHWAHVASTLVGISDFAESPNKVKPAAITLATLVSQFSVPDAVVEFDWAEMGDWHLLVLGLSEKQLTCSVDGVAVPILHWTPLGYEYDARSAVIKSESENAKPTITSLASPAHEATRPASGQYALDTSKGYPYHVALGGLKHERSSYEAVSSFLQVERHEEQAAGIVTLLQSVDSVVGGFAGSVGETIVIAGPVEDSKLQAWVREGPLNGFRDTKLPRLSALTVSAMRSAETTAAILAATQKVSADPPPLVIAFPSLLGANTSEHTTTESTKSIKMFASSGTVNLRDSIDIGGKLRNSKEREAAGVKFSSQVQVHLTAALSNAFSRIGGIRALYPLLAADKSRMVAALRIVSSLIANSKDAYQEFRSVEADKVLLYCTVQNPRLVSLETLQVLFDLIVASSTDASAPIGTAGGQGAGDTIQRVALLELLMDLVLALPRHSHLARATIDWLREVCDEHLQNCQKVLKSPGLLPVLVMLSSWELPGCEVLPRAATIASEVTADGATTAAPKNVTSAVVPAAEQQVKVRRERSLSLGSESIFGRSTQAIDISRAAVPAASVGRASVGAGQLGEAGIEGVVAGRLLEGDEKKAFEGRVRLMERVNMEFTQKTQSKERDMQAVLTVYAEKYKMQLSCARFLRLLISGTSGEVAHGGAQPTTNLLCTATDFGPQHLGALLSFAIVSCR
jgi:hypothetical protein